MDKNTVAEKMATYRLPTRMASGVYLYIQHGIEPGGFLKAILAGNLFHAARLTDDDNRRLLYQWADFVMEHLPFESWGSYDRMQAWIILKQKEWK